MTHTLNRRGLSEERPGEEMVVLCMVHRTEKTAKAEAMKKMVQTVLRHNPHNIIGAPLGLSENDIIGMASVAGVVTAVFNDREEVTRLIEEVKSQGLGISVVLSGLFKDTKTVCEHCALKEHTFNISLGIFGKTDRLPNEDTLAITTQCGHGLISPFLVENIVKKIKKGDMTSEEGAELLIKPCVCGIGNSQRISRILNKIVQGD
ncbi:MAG: hypothetical protein JRE40_01580 [Deltaproteobacteria bacterium]|nr:hypothetical protein [Deltaproteobacteria bacterium]